ncbi:MAG: helix-turn-helix transcriptional regulator [Kofleriaceae bacterium]|nr:helix-turn-helix transcriptional regulator [Kofleriaceae bacterium]
MSNFEIQFDFSSPDALSAFVDLLQIDSLLLASFTLGRPAGIASRDEYPVLHFIKNGRAIIVGHGIRHDLEPGDAVLLPRGGRGYVLGTGENVPVVPVEFSPEQKGLCCQRIGGDGPESEFLCCSFRVSRASLPLLQLLPSIVVSNGQNKGVIDRTFSDLFAEQGLSVETGRRGIALHLSSFLLLLMLRDVVAHNQGVSQGVLSAIADPRLAKVVTVLLDDLSENWSLDKLAGVAGMSRAAFAAVFHEKLGMTPMRYVHQCRMRQAAQLLCNPALSLSEVGGKVGYADPTSFSRAFRREFGKSPREFRRAETSEPLPK